MATIKSKAEQYRTYNKINNNDHQELIGEFIVLLVEKLTIYLKSF